MIPFHNLLTPVDHRGYPSTVAAKSASRFRSWNISGRKSATIKAGVFFTSVISMAVRYGKPSGLPGSLSSGLSTRSASASIPLTGNEAVNPQLKEYRT